MADQYDSSGAPPPWVVQIIEGQAATLTELRALNERMRGLEQHIENSDDRADAHRAACAQTHREVDLWRRDQDNAAVPYSWRRSIEERILGLERVGDVAAALREQQAQLPKRAHMWLTIVLAMVALLGLTFGAWQTMSGPRATQTTSAP